MDRNKGKSGKLEAGKATDEAAVSVPALNSPAQTPSPCSANERSGIAACMRLNAKLHVENYSLRAALGLIANFHRPWLSAQDTEGEMSAIARAALERKP